MSQHETETTDDLHKEPSGSVRDPFQPHSHRIGLTWSNVSVTLVRTSEERTKNCLRKILQPNDSIQSVSQLYRLQNQGTPNERSILRNVWGEAFGSEITALMGPSGAGKTTLLNVLTGRSFSPRLSVSHDLRLNNHAVDPLALRPSIAFVAQEDSLTTTATVREAILFSAKLRLPRDVTDDELDRWTDRMIAQLGLTAQANSLIGGSLVRGLSGGERKRVSIGVELVVAPQLIVLDEPTSGLDSFSALHVLQVLRKLQGAMVLLTIHQPSIEIFRLVDRLTLLNQGELMYQGLVSDLRAFYASKGYAVPDEYNPADWIMVRLNVWVLGVVGSWSSLLTRLLVSLVERGANTVRQRHERKGL